MKIRTNWRVMVEPVTGYHSEASERDAKELKSDIERHCDTNSVAILSTLSCSFCEERWDEFEDGMPACCDKAQEEWKKKK